ncbi:unnamed protein product [Thelazia callipaeda]|uniref:Protein quiver n=1 Tax=Thelazia callipaeda TaxID=103827 RepID=A0A0N5D265_THECL|nr:unnamed protein product [Thelazia callipaeda]
MDSLKDFVILISVIITGHICYHCVSYAHILAPNLRYQLGAQTDIFHWPIDASSPNCSKSLSSKNPYQFRVQICTKYPLCATISPNTANASFVVRGCMEQTLVTQLRMNKKFRLDGCHSVRSKQVNIETAPLTYNICICSTEYCNSEAQYSFSKTDLLDSSSHEVLDLIPTVKSEQLSNELMAETQNFATNLNPLSRADNRFKLMIFILFLNTLTEITKY